MADNGVQNIDKEELYLEQVKQIHAHEPVGLIATMVNSTILAVVHWHAVPHAAIFCWLAFLYALTLIRAVLLFKYKRIPLTVSEAHRWGKLFIIGITMSGIGWGSAGILLFPADSVPHQVFTAFVLGGMVAGAVAAFTPIKAAFFGYSIPALLPIVINTFLIPDNIHLAMGAMIVLFASLMFVTARNVHRMTVTSLELRFENRNLIEYLSHEKEKVENINKQLTSEISERKKAEAELKKHQEQLECLVEERTGEIKRANKELKKEIQEREQVEQALRESELKYRHLVDHANDSILIVQGGVIKFANPAALASLGCRAEELARMPFLDIIHPQDREKVQDLDTRRLQGEEVTSNYSFRIIVRSGEEILVDVSTALVFWQGRPASFYIVRNITEQRRLEEQLRQAQRMESLGTLAGGIAHGFNNLLMGIQGNISLMLHDYESHHPDYEKLQLIDEYVQSGVKLTDQLLGFARAGKYESKPTDLNELVQKTVAMFGRTKREIEIKLQTADNLWPVEADRGQIEQVLLNLYINASQAMPGGGKLTIETANEILENRFARAYEVAAGKYVKLTIIDTGVGMDEETQQRVFDPFFTTKTMGRGTGLGLASAYGIIKNHNGIIRFESKEGSGTTFYIYLPATTKPIPKEKAVPTKIIEAKETILLVDDEEMIVDVGEKMLRRMGFRVLVARSGREAVRIFDSHKDDIDLVILDMIMPGMDGEKTFKALRSMDPDVKVLVSSGYSLEDQAGDVLKHGCSGFIQKPFGMKAFSLKLSEVLGKSEKE